MTSFDGTWLWVLGGILLLLTLDLLRRRRLREELAWGWFLLSMVLMGLGWGEPGEVTPGWLWPVLGGVVMVVGLSLSVWISTLTRQVQTLTREMALLRAQVERDHPKEGGQGG